MSINVCLYNFSRLFCGYLDTTAGCEMPISVDGKQQESMANPSRHSAMVLCWYSFVTGCTPWCRIPLIQLPKFPLAQKSSKLSTSSFIYWCCMRQNSVPSSTEPGGSLTTCPAVGDPWGSLHGYLLPFVLLDLSGLKLMIRGNLGKEMHWNVKGKSLSLQLWSSNFLVFRGK